MLVEVNVAGEEGKGGIAPADLDGVHRALPGARSSGLMTMPPFTEDPEASRPYFARLAELAAEHGLERLSMGTSQDWQVAVEEGATIIRLGSAALRHNRSTSAWRNNGRQAESEPRWQSETHGRRALVYFGLAEGDYIEEGEYDEGDTGSEMALDPTAAAPREAVGGSSRRRGRDEESTTSSPTTSLARRRGRIRSVDDTAEEPQPRRGRRRSSAGNGGGVASMHVVTPRSFNDAQQVADEFKRSKPVIINLQTTDRELSKRLIDFSSGLTYALDGGMQRISQGIFLLTPRNVEVSAEEKARLLEGGFFNQS